MLSWRFEFGGDLPRAYLEQILSFSSSRHIIRMPYFGLTGHDIRCEILELVQTE